MMKIAMEAMKTIGKEKGRENMAVIVGRLLFYGGPLIWRSSKQTAQRSSGVSGTCLWRQTIMSRGKY
jgi:hypothetical protein